MNRIEDQTLISLNPATGEEVGRLPITPVDEIPAIVARAREAQVDWGQMSLQDRADAIRPFGAALAEAAEEVGTLLTREMGKPLPQGIGEARSCGESIDRTLDGMIEALTPEPMETPTLHRRWSSIPSVSVPASLRGTSRCRCRTGPSCPH